MSEKLLAGLAVMFILEGMLPFVSPGRWREAFQRATQLSDGQIRFIGLMSLLAGAVGLLLLGD